MTQTTFTEFEKEQSEETEPFDFDDYGPTMRRPISDVWRDLDSPQEVALREEQDYQISRNGRYRSDEGDLDELEVLDPGANYGGDKLLSSDMEPDRGLMEALNSQHQSPDRAGDNPRAVADGGQTETPSREYRPGETVRLIENPAVGLNTSPNIIEGEVSSSGKSVMIPEDEGLGNKRRRLDAETIFSGESEYRDSTGWELYTPGRLRSKQRSNYAPGPQAGSNGVSEAEDLPMPTHWPEGDDPDDAPEECPNCGQVRAPWKGKTRPMCEACGELAPEEDDQEAGSDTTDKWDLSQIDRGDCLILEGHAGEYVVVRIQHYAGTQTVQHLKVATRENREWQTYTLRKVDAAGKQRLAIEPEGERSVMLNVDDPDHARDFEIVGQDMQKVRRYIRDQ